MNSRIVETFIYKGFNCVLTQEKGIYFPLPLTPLPLPRTYYSGYVGVTKDHILYGKDKNDEVPNIELNKNKKEDNSDPMELLEKKGIVNFMRSMLEEMEVEKSNKNISTLGMIFSVHGGICHSDYSMWEEKTKLKDVVLEDDNYRKTVKSLSVIKKIVKELFPHYNKIGTDFAKVGEILAKKENKEDVRELISNLGENERKLIKYMSLIKKLKDFPDMFFKDGKKIESSRLCFQEKDFEMLVHNDDYWYFGFNTNQPMDHLKQWSKEQTIKEIKLLADQLSSYDGVEVIDKLIEAAAQKEEYEKCAELLKRKKQKQNG